MRLDNYSVRIVGGREVSGGYVEMGHGNTYSIRISNHRPILCDAVVMVDGKNVGVWRLRGYQSVALERPAHDHGKFTFYKVGTSEFHTVGGSEGKPDNGLVQVVFYPEKQRPISIGYSTTYPTTPTYRSYNYNDTHTSGAKGLTGSTSDSSASARGVPTASTGAEEGVTGLSDRSNQEFGTTYSIERDYDAAVTISLRLVAVDSGPRPLTAAGNPVPPPVG